MKTSEFKRWLKKQGCIFTEGTRHTEVHINGRSTTLPRHPSKEISTGTREAIVRLLGLKKDK